MSNRWWISSKMPWGSLKYSKIRRSKETIFTWYIISIPRCKTYHRTLKFNSDSIDNGLCKRWIFLLFPLAHKRPSLHNYNEIYHEALGISKLRGIRRWPVNSPHKRPVTRKMYPFDDVIMESEKFRDDTQGSDWLIINMPYRLPVFGHLSESGRIGCKFRL